VSVFSTVILVEGLFDLLSLGKPAFAIPPAPSGTHLTPAQLSQLVGSTGRDVYIAFDNDSQPAAKRRRAASRRLKSAGL